MPTSPQSPLLGVFSVSFQILQDEQETVLHLSHQRQSHLPAQISFSESTGPAGDTRVRPHIALSALLEWGGGESSRGWRPQGLAVTASRPFPTPLFCRILCLRVPDMAWRNREVPCMTLPCAGLTARSFICVLSLHSCFLWGAGWTLVGLAQAHMLMEAPSLTSS